MSNDSLTCSNCGGNIFNFDTGENFINCPYCDSPIKLALQNKKQVSNTKKAEKEPQTIFDRIDEYLINATNALEYRKFTEAISYCDRVLELDKNDYCAWLLKGKAISNQNSLDIELLKDTQTYFIKACENVSKSDLNEVMTEIKSFYTEKLTYVINTNALNAIDNFNEESFSALKSLPEIINNSYLELSVKCRIDFEDVNKVIVSEFSRVAREAFKLLIESKEIKVDYFVKKADLCISLLDYTNSFAKLVGFSEKDNIPRYKTINQIHYSVADLLSLKERIKRLEQVEELTKMVREIDPSFKKPRSQNCYIATAVYGSYSHPQVIALRKYRDEVLKRSLLGRLFIKLYYAISPPLAIKLQNASKMNRAVRNTLDIFIKDFIGGDTE